MAINLATLFYQFNTSSIQAATTALHAHGAAALSASRSAAGFQSTMARMQQPLVNLRSSLGFLQSGLASVAAGLGVTAVVQYMDAWSRMTGRLAAAKVPMEDIADIQNKIVEIAIRSRTPLEAVGNLYSRIARSSEALGVSQEEVGRATEIIAMALKTSGATAQETTSSLIQLSQALQKGTLNGDELRSILEQSPPLANAIAREFGTTVGNLQKMGAEGKLFATRVMKAILDSGREVERSFRAMPMTVADAWTNLLTRVEEYVGELNQASGATQPLIKGMQLLGDNIDRIGRGVMVIGTVLGTLATARGFTALLSVGRAFGWVGLVAAAIVGLVAVLFTFKDAMIQTEHGAVQLGDVMTAIARYIREGMDTIKAAIAEMPSFEEAFGIDDERIISTFKRTVNAIIGSAVFSVKAIGIIWDELPVLFKGSIAALETPINNFLNWMADQFEELLNTIIAGVNRTIDGINVLLPKAQELAQIEPVNVGHFARMTDPALEEQLRTQGERVGAAFGRAFAEANQDYVGQAAAYLSDTFNIMVDNIERRAAGIAYFRRKYEDSAAEAAANREYNRNEKDKNKPPGMLPPPGGKTKSNDYSRELEQTAKQTEALQIQIATFGMAEGAVARYRAEMELRNAAAREGITLDANAEANIKRVADAYGDAVEQLQRLNDQKEAANWMAQTLFDAVRGAESLSDAFNKLTSAIIDTLLQATLLGQGPLAGLFGTKQSGGALGSIFGNLLSGLMGGLGGGGGSSAPSPRTNPFFGHSGGLVGYGGVDPSYFAGLPRFGRGGWPGLTPGEVPIVAHKGEVIGWPEQMRSAFGNNKPEIQINNYAGNNVEARNERGPDGERVVIDIMKKAVASGQLDGPNRARYGVRPKKVVA